MKSGPALWALLRRSNHSPPWLKSRVVPVMAQPIQRYVFSGFVDCNFFFIRSLYRTSVLSITSVASHEKPPTFSPDREPS